MRIQRKMAFMENFAEMLENQDNLETTTSWPDGTPRPSRSCLRVQRSSVCSRTYFVVVMVFFHLYIINIIALLLYVHYNTGPADVLNNDQELFKTNGLPPPPNPRAPPSPAQPPSEELIFNLPRLEGIRVGHTQTVTITPDRSLTLRTLSLKPLLFEIPGFLSRQECGVIMQLAQLKGLSTNTAPLSSDSQEEHLTQDELFNLLDLNQDGLLQREEILSLSLSNDGSWLNSYNLREIHMGLKSNPAGVLSLQEFKQMNSDMFRHSGSGQSIYGQKLIRQKSAQTRLYLGEGTHPLLKNIRNRVTRLTRLPTMLIDLSEPMEVVRFEQGGFSHAHHDSGPAHPDSICAHTQLAANSSSLNQISCRYVTMLLFLNAVDGGGESSFPVSDNRTYDEEALGDLSQQYCTKGNLKIKPVPGTALLWYNHLSDGNGWVGDLDEFSLHGDCMVSHGSKWVGNIWINIDPDQHRQEHYQQLISGLSLRQEKQNVEHADLHQDL